MRLLSFIEIVFLLRFLSSAMRSDLKPLILNAVNSGGRLSARGLAVGLSFILAACSSPGVRVTPEAGAPQEAQEQPQPMNLTVAAVGDIMLGTDYPHGRLPPPELDLLKPVSHTLQQADIAFGNLEGVLMDGGAPVKQCSNPAHCYLFRTPSRFAEQLSRAGFDIMSLANNHARDFGEEGRSSSMAALAASGIHHSGREGDIASLEVKGNKVALIAFAPFAGANSMHALDQMKERIAQLNSNHDIVLVSFHGGAEGAGVERLPFAREFYHGEDRGDVVEFARLAVEAGADMVLGHGPHVPRALELYQGRLIAYSLGNFATYWGIKVSGANGLAPILTAELAPDGRFLSGKIVSARQLRPAGPVPDEAHTAAQMIRELTLADFPDTPLVIDKRGNISVVTPSLLSGAPPTVKP